MSLLAGKIVVITGSSRGIGKGCALRFAEYGASGLVLHYFGDDATTAEANELKAGIEKDYSSVKAILVPGDIGDPQTSQQVRITQFSKNGG